MEAHKLIDKLNLPKQIVSHVTGKEHNDLHHVITGFALVMFGSFLFGVHLHTVVNLILHSIAGYLHTVGFIPTVKVIEEHSRKKSIESPKTTSDDKEIAGNQ